MSNKILRAMPIRSPISKRHNYTKYTIETDEKTGEVYIEGKVSESRYSSGQRTFIRKYRLNLYHFLSVPEVAEILGIPPSAVRQAARLEIIKGVKIGTRYRFLAVSIVRFIKNFS